MYMEMRSTGLRERKHIETRSRLEEAALSLVIKEGLEKTTIDAISEAANVSPRTFFNYFDGKEDAILGVDFTYENNENTTLEFQVKDDLIETIVTYIFGFINPTKYSRQLQKKRARLIRQYPTLFEKQIGRLTKINDALVAKVKSMILLQNSAIDPLGAANYSEVIVMACIGGVRIAVKEWLAEGTESLTDDVKQRAVKIIKEATKVIERKK